MPLLSFSVLSVFSVVKLTFFAELEPPLGYRGGQLARPQSSIYLIRGYSGSFAVTFLPVAPAGTPNPQPSTLNFIPAI